MTSSNSGNQADSSLARWDDRLWAVVDSSLDAVITIDSVGRVLHWNSKSEVVFGWTKEEARGRKLADLIAPAAHHESHILGLQQYLETGKGTAAGQRLEMTAIRKGGATFPAEVSIAAIPGATASFTAPRCATSLTAVKTRITAHGWQRSSTLLRRDHWEGCCRNHH